MIDSDAIDNTKQPGRETDGGSRWKRHVRRLGLGGVLLFSVKGLLWLLAPLLIARGCL